ncbi:MAG: (5-formylfuran-3-yl)methyl phosphate synthase [Isosphaeraceae bacterium]|nr:(5-formylfuran-3-yl)methyl phosphate synthase [Isosphaeraceae bacterium]
MAGLLVSVRSAEEAEAALAGGATVIDVKEPDRGPLGRADVSVWSEVRAVTPAHVPVSVALGELSDWAGVSGPRRVVTSEAFAGISYRKLGLAGARRSWIDDWASCRCAWGRGPAWVAVAYADWKSADAPSVEEVLQAAVSIPDCAGLLIDTYDKTVGHAFESCDWRSLIDRSHEYGRFVALAGGLTEAAIARLAPLGPDLFAVRGAACRDCDRRASVDADRVARLARLVTSSGKWPLVPKRGVILQRDAERPALRSHAERGNELGI